jgi:hypothetical protein
MRRKWAVTVIVVVQLQVTTATKTKDMRRTRRRTTMEMRTTTTKRVATTMSHKRAKHSFRYLVGNREHRFSEDDIDTGLTSVIVAPVGISRISIHVFTSPRRFRSEQRIAEWRKMRTYPKPHDVKRSNSITKRVLAMACSSLT